MHVCSIERRMMRTHIHIHIHIHIHMHSFFGEYQRGTGRRIQKRTRNAKVNTSARSSAATLHTHNKRARQSKSTDVSIHQFTASPNKFKPSTHQTCTVLTLDRNRIVIKLCHHVYTYNGPHSARNYNIITSILLSLLTHICAFQLPPASYTSHNFDLIRFFQSHFLHSYHALLSRPNTV